MARLTGGEHLARTLVAANVEEVFTLHGGHLDAFLVACPDLGIRLTDMRHEASAGHAAEAYARTTGRLGVCVVTAGPGFTNAVTAIANAYLDASPVLFVVGAPPLREVETNPLQGGFDQVAMARPVTKWAHRITHVERVRDLAEKAIRTATSGRPGPVLLEVPIDVMFGVAEADAGPPLGNFLLEHPPAPAPDAVERTVELMQRAERPVIIPGGGAILPGAASHLERLARVTGIPVAAGSKARGILPNDHPSNVGGTAGLGIVNARPDTRADLVVLLGARAGLFLGGRGGGVIPHDATVVQVDVEGAEIGRLRPIDIPIVADAGATVAALAQAAEGRRWPDRGAWVSQLAAAGGAIHRLFADAPGETRSGLLHPYHAAKAAADALDADTTLILDGGEAAAWCDPHLRHAGPGRTCGTGYLGCLGVAQGFAVGAARGVPGRPVVIFTGDGALGFHIAELDTMVRHRLPVVTVVLNNACWGMSQNGQDIVYGRNRRSVVALGDTHYDQVAVAFGGYGERVERVADVAPAVRRAIDSGLPACINLITDPDVVHPVTPAMVGEVDASGQIAVPYYENLPDG